MLSIRDRAVLNLADTPYSSPGRKVNAMWHLTGYSETAFWKRLDELVDLPEAEAEIPAIVRRLKCLRETRRNARKPRQPVG